MTVCLCYWSDVAGRVVRLRTTVRNISSLALKEAAVWSTDFRTQEIKVGEIFPTFAHSFAKEIAIHGFR